MSTEKCMDSPLQVITLPRSSIVEYFITAAPALEQPPAAMLQDLAAFLAEHDAHVIAQDIFGEYTPEAFCSAFPGAAWPVTAIRDDRREQSGLLGTQVWAISGADVQPVEIGGQIAGRFFEDEHARYCRLGGLLPSDPADSPEEQTQSVFDQMVAGLGAVGMDFSHVVRTWFFNDDITAWYGVFNEVRDAFFREHGVFDGLVPASTGIGGANAVDAALAAGLLAVQPKTPDVKIALSPSPLQCPALDYGSSFSRATSVEVPGIRRLLVSGTASIAPEGETLHIGDTAAQIALTMEVVAAMLQVRDMGWEDVVRATTYLKHAADFPAFERYCQAHNLPSIPRLCVNNDVCRDNLLFEIELDAATTT